MRGWIHAACISACAACGRVGFDAVAAAGDGAVGEGADEDATAALFCDRPHSPVPTVCADFDRGLPVLAGFTTMQVDGVGRLGLVDGVNDSPTSLGAQLDMQTNGTPISHAALLYRPPGQPSRVTLTADVFVVDPPSADYEINSVVINTATETFTWDVNLNAGGGAMFFEELYVPSTMQFSAMSVPLDPIARQAWHTITVQVDIANRTRELVIDGLSRVSGPTRFAMTPGAMTVSVGIAWSRGLTSPVGTYIDNVLITVE